MTKTKRRVRGFVLLLLGSYLLGSVPFALVIGNEARGVSDEVSEVADVRLKLPMRGGAESLNAAVAAAIFMYELMNH